MRFSYKLLIIIPLIYFACKQDSKKERVKSISSIKKNKKIEIVADNIKDLNISLENSEKILIPSDISDSPALNTSELVSDIKYIPLETSEECLIGHIDNIFYDSGSYFIHDKRNNKLLRFNDKGEFLNPIGSIGKGPEELLSILDIALNKKEKFISILDYKRRKISKYTYSGKLISSEPLFYVVSQHEYSDKNMVFSITKGQKNIGAYAISNYSLLLADNEFVPFGSAFKNPEKSFTRKTISPLRKFNENIYYHYPFSNGIWKVLDSTIKPMVKFEFEGNGLPNDTWKKSLNNKEIKQLLDNHLYFSGNYVISDDFYFFMIFGNKKVSLVFYNKVSKELKYGSGLKFDDKNLLTALISYPITAQNDGCFISFREAIQLFKMKEHISKDSKLKNSLSKNDWERINKIKQTDNPVIVTYKLKDF